MKILVLMSLLLMSGCAAYVTSDAEGRPHVGMLSLVPVAGPPVYATEWTR